MDRETLRKRLQDYRENIIQRHSDLKGGRIPRLARSKHFADRKERNHKLYIKNIITKMLQDYLINARTPEEKEFCNEILEVAQAYGVISKSEDLDNYKFQIIKIRKRHTY
jgi:hypothetical protein